MAISIDREGWQGVCNGSLKSDSIGSNRAVRVSDLLVVEGAREEEFKEKDFGTNWARET